MRYILWESVYWIEGLRVKGVDCIFEVINVLVVR